MVSTPNWVKVWSNCADANVDAPIDVVEDTGEELMDENDINGTDANIDALVDDLEVSREEQPME